MENGEEVSGPVPSRPIPLINLTEEMALQIHYGVYVAVRKSNKIFERSIGKSCKRSTTFGKNRRMRKLSNLIAIQNGAKKKVESLGFRTAALDGRVMEKFRNFLVTCLIGLVVAASVIAQSQSGFISIDCGIRDNSSYTDKTTGLKYISDATFIDNGVSKSVSPEYNNTDTLEQQFWNVRSFPDGIKNCFTLKPAEAKGNKILIRARFMYGNYDRKDSLPVFDLYLGANKWDSVKLENASTITSMEIIHIPFSSYIHVCLVNTGYGTPFMSALELRPLKNSTYRPADSVVLYRRFDMGSEINSTIRYKDDVSDRIWKPFNFNYCKVLSTPLAIDSSAQTVFQPPSIVMSTAITPINESNPLELYMRPSNPTAKYYSFFHFAEVEKLQPNQSREFEIYQNGEFWRGPISLDYLHSTTVYSLSPASGDKIQYMIYKTNVSTHPPILNAIEVYIGHDLSQSQTNDQEVDAVMNIKSKYGLKENWQGDPCAPKAYMWKGLNCSYEGSDKVRITYLNLSSSGLTGEIPTYISDLNMLQSLDLSNNSLTGSVPDFLSKMQFLKVLNLRDNDLKGSIPTNLLKRSNSGSLLLSVAGNQNLCSSLSCKKKGKTNLVPVVASSSAVLFVLLITLAVLWTIKTRRQTGKANNHKHMRKIESLELKNNQFTYSEILNITNNFEKIIGKGGFGAVYHGYLNDAQVAVKLLSASSAQGYKEFKSEVKLLVRVHHRNLTSLVGYCYEDNHMALVYEYMANGNLEKHLSDKNAYVLSWEDRLQIAMDAAQGLEYLHHGCKPPIVHRDVKTTNILLDEKFQAKLADFGLSRAFSTEGHTHVSTVVAGTLGYLDPEYYNSNWLNEKSDVYSFGVVLLEIITSRPVIINTEDTPHISQWVEEMLEKGEIKDIVDPRLRGGFDASSAWKAVEVAMTCVHHTSVERPTMNQVVVELKECLSLDIAQRNNGSHHIKGPNRLMTLNVYSELAPMAR